MQTTTEVTLRHLGEEMTRLDALLQRRVAAFQAAGRELSDLLGTYVTDAQVNAVWQRPFGAQDAPSANAPKANQAKKAESPSRLSQLRREYDLNDFAFDAFLLCLAPALDGRYERIYGYLHDDVTRRQATPSLILDALSGPTLVRLTDLLAFGDDAPLIKTGLLERSSPDALLPSRPLRVPERVVLWLLGGWPDLGAREALRGERLGQMTHRLVPRYGWDDLVLPDDCEDMLHELVAHVHHRERVLREWGVGRKLASNAGVSALFSGPPGTGKTMAAEVIASALNMPLYKVDLSMLVSKFIGETEKNLERAFSEAEQSQAILFFDEADALFGKRSSVQDAHDRYANLEVSYLLQRMDSYNGVVLLATNLRANMDEAFTRRLHFVIDFPFPDETQRSKIWETLWPQELPRESAINFGALARRHKLAGGSIRNIIVSAAYLAASNGGMVTSDHVAHGLKREMQKMGRLVSTDGNG